LASRSAHFKERNRADPASSRAGSKGKIAAVSPYILITQDASRWPSGSAGDVSFSLFRTIDAVDLPKAMELFSTRLSPSFSLLYEDIRKKRNIFTHSVSKGERIAAIDVLKYILETFEELFQGQRWPSARLAYLTTYPAAVAYSTDHSHPRLIKEMEKVVNELSPAEATRFLGVNVKARWYKCAGACYRELRSDEFADRSDPALAQLTPAKTPRAKHLYCFVCGDTVEILRKKCNSPACPADVIFKDVDSSEECLSCGHDQSD
jgi:hypothetical protein